ncbi:hypothetical protein TWF703_007824 [Orbilia oligospora]|uniref:RRM domain-containing protein n=3 Tax=Orbilia oligospora TaxID=2813651 RepID=A0A7C8P0S3_ORBOL|nr:hypothetical protein TWF703_007824 [Orbilia oligospora]
MDHDEYADEAIFDDLYDEEPQNATTTSKPAAATATVVAPAAAPISASQPDQKKSAPVAVQSVDTYNGHNLDEYTPADPQQSGQGGNVDYSGYGNMNQDYNGYNQSQGYGNDGNGWNEDQHGMNSNGQGPYGDGSNMGGMHNQGPSADGGSTAIKEDGKMFIGGLNWETTDESLRDYFSQFGEVSECTVMRDGPSGRSRGFGFLTFKDPKTVNIVMVKEHYLDGKIIDPKRAIPRDEQERTSKIFVGGVSQEASEEEFKNFFMQFGRVIDSTLMIDKETGRPRGFGFVTFDNEAAVDLALQHPDLRIRDKPIEVKKAQPRGNARERNFEEDSGNNRHHNNNNNNNFRDRGHNNNRFGQNRDHNQGGNSQDHSNFNPQNAPQNMQNAMNPAGGNPAAGYTNGMTPAMLAQYWQRMQQYMMVMMQQQAQMQMRGGNAGGQQPNMMQQPNMANFNPQMMAQMQQMQQMQGMPGGMNPMGMNGMPPQMGGGSQGQNPGFPNMNQQGGYQPKSPNMSMQQPYNGGDGSIQGGQQEKSPDPSQQQMGQGGMWNNGMYEDPNGSGDGQGNRGMHGGGFKGQNFNAPTGPKSGAAGPPPNAPTGPRNARNPPSGPAAGGGSGGGGGTGPFRNSGRRGGYGGGFHPYQRN